MSHLTITYSACNAPEGVWTNTVSTIYLADMDYVKVLVISICWSGDCLSFRLENSELLIPCNILVLMILESWKLSLQIHLQQELELVEWPDPVGT